MKQMKKLIGIIVSAALTLSMSGCQNKGNTEEQKKFDEFIENEFIETMESDYTAMHVFLQHPENFGVDPSKVEVTIGSKEDEETRKEIKEEVRQTYEEFKKFNRENLTEEQQDTYDIYEYMASISEKEIDDKFDYYNSLFGSMTGDHYQLPILLADWTLRNEQDVKDLILLVKDVKPYMDSALEYTRKQEELGLLMIDIDSVIDYCTSILDKGENSSVLASMNENIDALGLDETKTNQYKEELKEAFVTSFLPAYEDILETMKTLKASGKNNEEGLAKFEHGKEYYEVIMQSNIGTTKSIDEIKKMIELRYKKCLSNIMRISIMNPDALKPLLEGNEPETNYTSYSEILDDISSRFFEDFPEVKNLEYNIKDVNEEIASDSGVTAYFNIPSIDGDSVKQLRVNPLSNNVKSISTYSTVAHEGYPGHMYQNAYVAENIDNNFRKTLVSVPAYTEGYAVYAQNSAYKYLDGFDQDLLKAISENEIASYCIVILADIGIHYEGWSLQEYKEFLNSQGFEMDDEAVLKQYKQQQANPAAFQPYYIGYMEFMNLKEKAQETLEDKFNEKEFNEAILESGTAPFNVVERHVDAYIERKK